MRAPWTRESEMSPTERQTLVVVSALAFSASVVAGLGCSSSSSGATGSAAKQYFDSSVYPAIQPTCLQCHGTGENGAPIFLAATADGSYTAIDGTPGLIAPPTSSPLVQHGLHTGPALTADQNTVMTTWLKMEVKERGLTDTGKPQNLWAAFQAFGACMDYTQWTALTLDTIAQQATDGNQGQCQSCHNQGQGSNWLSPDAADTFNHIILFPYVERLVTGTVDDQGAFAGLEASNRYVQKGIETRQANANSHPTFTLSSTLSNNITQFVAETISNMNANACTNVPKPDAGPEGGADAGM
jgi:hypothetical protein